MPVTGFVMNLCVFGAVAAGPTIGGLQAAGRRSVAGFARSAGRRCGHADCGARGVLEQPEPGLNSAH
jgi:hypothetical protein